MTRFDVHPNQNKEFELRGGELPAGPLPRPASEADRARYRELQRVVG
jgi:hypothetical protein